MHMKKTGFYDRVLRGLYVAPGDFSITSPSGYTCIDVYPVYDVYIYIHMMIPRKLTHPLQNVGWKIAIFLLKWFLVR